MDGAAYLPEQIRVVEIDAAIDALTTAHQGWDNFYNEIAPARALEALVGPQGSVPAPLSNKFVRIIVHTFLGNGSGVSNAALPSYTRMLEALTPNQAGRALRAFTDPSISSLLWTSIGRRQWTALLDVLEPKMTRPADRALYDEVRAFAGTPDQLHGDSRISRLAESGARRPRRQSRS